MAQHGATQHGTTQHGATQHGAAQHVVAGGRIQRGRPQPPGQHDHGQQSHMTSLSSIIGPFQHNDPQLFVGHQAGGDDAMRDVTAGVSHHRPPRAHKNHRHSRGSNAAVAAVLADEMPLVTGSAVVVPTTE